MGDSNSSPLFVQPWSTREMEFKATHSHHTDTGTTFSPWRNGKHMCPSRTLHSVTLCSAKHKKKTTTNSLFADESAPKPWKILQLAARKLVLNNMSVAEMNPVQGWLEAGSNKERESASDCRKSLTPNYHNYKQQEKNLKFIEIRLALHASHLGFLFLWSPLAYQSALRND